MGYSEAQRRATNKYRRANYKQKCLLLRKDTDADIIMYLEENGIGATELVRDMWKIYKTKL